MNFIKFSFYYIFAYLGITAAGLILAPETLQRLLRSSEIYPTPAMRFAGMFAMLVSILALQLARKNLYQQLYRTTLFARVIALCILGYLIWETRNPMFMFACGILVSGMTITLVGHFKKQ